MLSVKVIDNCKFWLIKLVIFTSKLIEDSYWVNFTWISITIWTISIHITIDDFTEPALKLREAKRGVLVQVVGEVEIINTLSAVFTVKVIDDSKLRHCELIIITLVLIKDFFWIKKGYCDDFEERWEYLGLDKMSCQQIEQVYENLEVKQEL